MKGRDSTGGGCGGSESAGSEENERGSGGLDSSTGVL